MCLVFNNSLFFDNRSPYVLACFYPFNARHLCRTRSWYPQPVGKEFRSPLFYCPRGPHRTSICRPWGRRVFFSTLYLGPPTDGTSTTAIDAYARHHRISSYKRSGFSRLGQVAERQPHLFCVRSFPLPLLFNWFFPSPHIRLRVRIDPPMFAMTAL